MVAGNVFVLVFAILSFLCLLGLLWFFVRRLLSLLKMLAVNSAVGLTVAIVLGWLGMKVPLTTAVLLVIALFGLAGLGSILILMFFGVKLQ